MIINIPLHSSRNLLILRLYYFILTGSSGFIIPFLALFYRRQGLNGTEIGLLGTAGAFAGLLAAPFWGRWSDKSTNPRRLLQASFLSSAVVYLLISQQAAFIWLAALICLSGMIGAGGEPMSDAMTMNLLKGQSRSGFGSVRLWGSLGWAATVYLSGWLIEKTTIVSAFTGYAVLMVASILVIQLLDLGKRETPANAVHKPSVSIRQMFKLIGSDKALLGLALALSIVWLTRTGVYQFQAIYMDQLGAKESLIGLVITLGALIEIPGMWWADQLVRRYGSHQVLGAALLIFALSNGFVVAYPSIATILASAFIGGIGFSFYSVGIVVFLSERAPLGQTTTILAIFTSTLRGLILMAAAPMAGLIFDFSGAYWIYVGAVFGCLAGAVIFRLFVTGKRSGRTAS